MSPSCVLTLFSPVASGCSIAAIVYRNLCLRFIDVLRTRGPNGEEYNKLRAALERPQSGPAALGPVKYTFQDLAHHPGWIRSELSSEQNVDPGVS